MIQLPDSHPFEPAQQGAIQQLLASLQPAQMQWLSGYLAGVSQQGGTPAPAASRSGTPLTVLYGTESGNSEALADLTVKTAKKKGFKAKMVNMADIEPASLKKAVNLLVIVSTWGDGEPPEAAEAFHKSFMKEDLSLSGVQFSVCSLGDTSYEQFCQTGKDFDTRLETLGAKRLYDRVDCDVDYDELHQNWMTAVLDQLGGSATTSAAPALFAPVATVEYGKKNPFPAELAEKVILNGAGSQKETWHYEFNLEGSGLQYEAGDALALQSVNADDVVADLIQAGRLQADAKVEVKGVGEVTLEKAFKENLDITALSKNIIKKYQALTGSKELEALLADENKASLKDYLWGRQIADLITDYPSDKLTAQGMVDLLRKLPVRLYSIASSPKAHPGEVHLTVASVRYDAHGKSRKGVASTFLADEVTEGDVVKMFIQPNKNFRLPESDDTNVIMVGPGTGIAPFRAFVEERAEREATGKNWLFFGDQHFSYDFLYQLEWQDHLKSGSLHRLDVAFSRDQPEKYYVQDVMREKGAELYEWLEGGASFYVCGDATRMANDVNEALLEIISTYGSKSRQEAEDYVAAMKKEKRYLRDVY